MDILVVGFNYRNINNISAGLLALQACGHTVQTLLFPNKADPSWQRLAELPFECIGSYELELSSFQDGIYHANSKEEQTLPLNNLQIILEKIQNKYQPKLLLLTGCQRYPENSIYEICKNWPSRPTIIGLQHGVNQRWEWYNQRFAFDYFACFGKIYFEKFESKYQERLISVGLPKLGSLPTNINYKTAPNILFCGQNTQDPKDIERLLKELEIVLAKKAIIRPHPEHTGFFDALREQFEFSTQVELSEDLKRAYCVITTGSSVALESLVAIIPTVVLKDESAAIYENLKIVQPVSQFKLIHDTILKQGSKNGTLNLEPGKLELYVENKGIDNEQIFCKHMQAML